MIDDEVPRSIASVVGHVCGVIAVGMAALGMFGVWALARKLTMPGLVLESLCIAVSLLMFRWAGALTGYWDTRGRLAVPKAVYACLVFAFAGLAAVGAMLLVFRTPSSFDDAWLLLIGVLCSGVLSHLCRLATQRFK